MMMHADAIMKLSSCAVLTRKCDPHGYRLTDVATKKQQKVL